MIKHLGIIAVITCLISLFVFLPYFPGEYDNSTAILSFYTQVVSFLGLILVPLGITWLIFETRKNRRQNLELSHTSYRLTRLLLFILLIIFLLADLVVFMNNNLSLAIISIILTGYFFIRSLSFLQNLKNANLKTLNPVPLYIICVPMLALFIRFMFIDRAVTSSRKSAIIHAEQLIRDIEIFKLRNGHYPVSMLSVVKDYKTMVRGSGQYHYERNGKSYNIYFEQNSNKFGVREIVMYNMSDNRK